MLPDPWRLAAGTLTAIPVPPPGRVDRTVARRAMLLAPLAVLPLGALVAAVGIAGYYLTLPPAVVAVLAIGALAAGSRAFHLDGLSDTVDGLTASYDRERSLAVMKTGTAGPAGVVALIVVLGLQATALTALVDSVRGVVLAAAAVCVSRCALALCCARGLRPARPDGLGVTYAQTVPRIAAAALWVAAAVLLAALGWWAGLDWWRGALAVGCAMLVLLALLARTNRRFGGVTGDVFGAAVEIALATLLIALV
ncbi:adenosylcobinamide-GDP ribazoletransferase [Melissospora conviva]|uniref:adenosylcobinamide-GDP ribazoletransferase n=1 Tax=Melissospora conviva TaxID=3388432 RepID=UPI003C14BF1E